MEDYLRHLKDSRYRNEVVDEIQDWGTTTSGGIREI
jgi:hypothetical protein